MIFTLTLALICLTPEELRYIAETGGEFICDDHPEMCGEERTLR